MSKKTNNAAEEHVASTLAHLQKSYKKWIMATAIILVLEIGYFAVINYFFATNVTVVSDYIGIYEEDFNSTLNHAKQFPKKSEYEKHVKFLEKVLDKIIDVRENHPREMVEFETTADKINQAKDPEGIAHLISIMVRNEIKWQGSHVSSYARDYMAEEMKKLPMGIHKQIPKYGSRLRFEATNWINFFCIATSEGMGETFDTFLDKNADQIKKFSEATDDEAFLVQLDEEFIKDFAHFLETAPIENYGTLKQQSDSFLHRIKAANELLKPLVRKKASELTADELRLRRSVGLFMHLVKNPANLQPEKN